jgi:hypothetical protein
VSLKTRFSLYLPLFVLVFACKEMPAQIIKENWAPKTRAAIDEVITKNSKQKNAYAVFDWDNTSVYGDVQETLLVYQIETLSFKMTPDEFKYSFTHFSDNNSKANQQIPEDSFEKSFSNVNGASINITSLTEDCVSDYKYFYDNYRGMNKQAKGNFSLDEIKKNEKFKDFKAKMWFTYEALSKSFSVNVAYTWVMYVTIPGYNRQEFRKLVIKAIDWGMKRESKKVYFDSPMELPGKAGVIRNSAIDNYFCNTIHPTKEIGLLFKQLIRNKINVFISTASFQEIVDVIATTSKYGYNLPKNHVMGLRLKIDPYGRYLPAYDFASDYVINSMDGKSININNLLVKKYVSNPIMIGGDSDGDYFMITQFSSLNNSKMINDYPPVQLVLIVNRLKRGRIGELCKIGADQLGNKNIGLTRVVLQGHDENKGEWIPTEKTLKLGKFGDENLILLP